MSRITIEVSEQQHQYLKALAALEGQSIKDYALQRLFPAASDGDVALLELKALLAPRIAEALRGDLSSQNVDEIVEDEIRANGAA